MEEYKIVVLGESGVGKTTYIRQLLGKEPRENYKPTQGVNVRLFRFDGVQFTLWDIASDSKLRGLGKDYYIKANGALILFDSSKKESIEKWENEFREVCPNAPIVYVDNNILDSNENLLRPIREMYKKL